MQTPEQMNWDPYYDYAEKAARSQFEAYFLPEILRFNLYHTLDFACGRGRIAELFQPYCCKMTLVDVNQEALDIAKGRIKGVFLKDIGLVDNKSITFLYSWDSMVHFDKPRLKYYFAEFKRVLIPGGAAMIHHSNLGQGQNWDKNVHGRAAVSAKDVKEICLGLGFNIISQKIIDWGEPQKSLNLDCITTISYG